MGDFKKFCIYIFIYYFFLTHKIVVHTQSTQQSFSPQVIQPTSCAGPQLSLSNAAASTSIQLQKPSNTSAPNSIFTTHSSQQSFSSTSTFTQQYTQGIML